MQMLKDVMTHDVMVISPDATLQEAASRMRDAGFGMMPVGENDRMIGVVSDRDIVMRAVADGKGCETPVRDVMSEGVVWAYEDDTVEEGARKMSEHQVRRLSDDHANLARLADGLAQAARSHPALQGRITVHPWQTNILFTDLAADVAPAFVAWLATCNVRVTSSLYGGATRLRWVTHLDVSAADVDAALECVAQFKG